MNYAFMVQCIITSKNVNNILENIIYLQKLGVRCLKIEPVHISKISRDTPQLLPKPKDFVDNFTKSLIYIAHNNLDLKIDSSFFARPTLGYYCGISSPNINITPYGTITACVEVCRDSDIYSNKFIWGRYSFEKEK